MVKFIIVIGNPIEGLEFLGYFDSVDEAAVWADTDRRTRSQDWWVGEIEDVT